MVYNNLTLSFYLAIMIHCSYDDYKIIFKGTVLVIAYIMHIMTIYISNALKNKVHNEDGYYIGIYSPHSVMVSMLSIGICTKFEILKKMVTWLDIFKSLS